MRRERKIKLEIIKIKSEKIGLKKVFEVKNNINNQEKTNDMWIKLLKSGNSNETGEDFIAELVSGLETDNQLIKDVFDYLVDILKLSSKQVEIIKENNNFIDLVGYVNYVIARIKGRSEEDLEKEEKEAKEEDVDPKKG